MSTEPPPKLAKTSELPAQPNLVQKPESTASMLVIPIDPYLKLTLGRMDARYTVHDLTLAIENQNTLSGLIFDTLTGLVSIQLPITRLNS